MGLLQRGEEYITSGYENRKKWGGVSKKTPLRVKVQDAMWRSCIEHSRAGKSNLHLKSVSSLLSAFCARSVSSERNRGRTNRPESPAGAGLYQTNISPSRTKEGWRGGRRMGLSHWSVCLLHMLLLGQIVALLH